MAKETTYEEIVRNIKNKVYSPIYFLMGEEDYYIDRIADYIMDSVLNETEKEFNQTVLYGADTDIVVVPRDLTRGSEHLEEPALRMISLHLGLVVDSDALLDEWRSQD